MSESTAQHPFPVDRVRIDKWLWAARFYKTRSLAKQALEGGKVRYNGARCKTSKEVEIGALIELRQGYDELEVEVMQLSDQRRGASEARLLYQETQTSIERRERNAAMRKNNPSMLPPESRPNKKQRRHIHRFKRENS